MGQNNYGEWGLYGEKRIRRLEKIEDYSGAILTMNIVCIVILLLKLYTIGIVILSISTLVYLHHQSK